MTSWCSLFLLPSLLSCLSLYCCNPVKIVPDTTPPVASVTVFYNDTTGKGVQQSVSSASTADVSVMLPAHTKFTIMYSASDPDGVHTIAMSYTVTTSSDGTGTTRTYDGSPLVFGTDCPKGAQLSDAQDFPWPGHTSDYRFTATASDYNRNSSVSRNLNIHQGP